MFEPVHLEAKKLVEKQSEEIHYILLKDYCKKNLGLKLISVELNYQTKEQLLTLVNTNGVVFKKTLRQLFKKELDLVHCSNQS